MVRKEKLLDSIGVVRKECTKNRVKSEIWKSFQRRHDTERSMNV